MESFIDQDKGTATSDKRFYNETANDRWMGLSSTCRRIVCIFQKEKEKDVKKKQDDETKVYLVYDEELDQFVLKKGDDCTILEVLDLKDPGTEKLISILIKALEREFVIDLTAYIKLMKRLEEYSDPEEHLEYISSLGPDGKFLIRSR